MKAGPPCPLCVLDWGTHFHRDRIRQYWHCQRCDLVFVAPEQRPTAAQERHLYDQHQNSPADTGYRRFLNRLAAPLCERLEPTQTKGLDFGCGPGPTLSVMLRERGLTVTDYDPIYSPTDPDPIAPFDFITCTEVMEHFHQPARDWARLCALLKPGGWLGIMTKLHQGKAGFADWHYKNDPTHVSFYSRQSFAFLSQRDNLQLVFPAPDVILLRSPRGS